MPEKTKQKEELKKQAGEEKSADENCETGEKGNWSEDQKENSYYYDDSHGYEIYNPDEDEDE